jgi:DnaJ domain
MAEGRITDLYSILDVGPESTDEEIRKAYYAKTKTFHPDKARTEEDRILFEKRIKDINEAYKVLSDPDSRRQYKDATAKTIIDFKTEERDTSYSKQFDYIAVSTDERGQIKMEMDTERFNKDFAAKTGSVAPTKQTVVREEELEGYIHRRSKIEAQEELKIPEGLFNHLFEKLKDDNVGTLEEIVQEPEGIFSGGDFASLEETHHLDLLSNKGASIEIGMFKAKSDIKVLLKELVEDLGDRAPEAEAQQKLTSSELLEHREKWERDRDLLGKCDDFIIKKTETEINFPALFNSEYFEQLERGNEAEMEREDLIREILKVEFNFGLRPFTKSDFKMKVERSRELNLKDLAELINIRREQQESKLE